MQKLNHKIINEIILKKFGYKSYKSRPKNYTYFIKGELEFFIEIIPPGKYFKTIFIKFLNIEFFEDEILINERKEIIKTIHELYRQQNEGFLNYCIYSGGIINNLF